MLRWRRGLLRTTLLSGLGFWGLACGALPADDPGSASAPEGQAPNSLPIAAEPEASRVPVKEGLAVVVLFAAGPDGLLHSREVELPHLSTTRGRAEVLVQKIVEDSGTFPAGVQVLDVFVSGRGVAVVNFTLDLLEGHSGGLHAEELTVYSLSHTLVESLPAIAEVRLLVEGQETETLAGHLDLRSGFGRAPERLLADSSGGGP